MFNGNWVEADKQNITIEIADPRVDIACEYLIYIYVGVHVRYNYNLFVALDVVFGSMYQDEIDLQPSKLVNIFATALMFQLKDLQDRCVESMLETINAEVIFCNINFYIYVLNILFFDRLYSIIMKLLVLMELYN